MFTVTTKSIVTAAVMLAMASMPSMAADLYKSNQGHTEVLFGWSHAGVSRQNAEFQRAQITLSLDADNIEESSVEAVIETDSLATGFVPLDVHLKASDYLNVSKYPTITFKSTSIARTGEKTADITGDLTLHGVTLPVTLEATLTHRGRHPVAQYISAYSGQWVAFHASTEIDHLAFGVSRYSTGPISIEINTELKQQ